MSLPEIPFKAGAKVRVTQMTDTGTVTADGTVLGPAYSAAGWGVAIQFADGSRGWAPVEAVTLADEDGAR